MTNCARRIAKSISFKRFVQEEVNLTERSYEEAENFIIRWYKLEIHKEKRKVITSKFVQEKIDE